MCAHSRLLFGDDLELSELGWTETGRQGNVCGIAATRNQYPTDPWLIVPRVEGIPTALQKHLEPRTEVHWVRNWRHADITEIAGAVSCWDIHAAAQSDRQMGKVAAHADAFLVPVPSRPRRACVRVAEGQAVMHVVADRLNACPSWRHVAEERPGGIRKTVRSHNSGCRAEIAATRPANSPPGSVLHRVRPRQADHCRRPRYHLKQLECLEASQFSCKYFRSDQYRCAMELADRT